MENFLVLKGLDKRNRIYQQLLLSQLRERKLPKHFNKTIAKITNGNIAFSSEVFLHEYKLTFEKDQMNAVLNPRKPLENIEEGLLNLDLYYILEKLRNICEIYNSKTIFELEDVTFLNDEVIQLAKQPPFNQYPQIQIYSCLLETIKSEENEESFLRLQELVNLKGRYLSKNEERDVYIVLINFCIRKINQGEVKSLETCFLLYQMMAQKKLLVQGKYLSPWTFKNIITAALRLNEVEWTKEFIKTYKDKLSIEHRHNAYHYNLAKYNFHLKQYDKVLTFLQRVEYEDIFYGLDARTLLMKVYFAQNETEALFSLADSFRIYLRRKKKIPQERSKTYLNFIKFVKKLIQLNPRDYKKLDALRSKVKESLKVADKSWILEMIELKIKKIESLYTN